MRRPATLSIFLVLCFCATEGEAQSGSSQDTASAAGEVEREGRRILEGLQRMADEMETGARPVMDSPPVRPEHGATYPPARFTGPCSIWQAPEEIRPGDRWTVKNVVTDFFRVEEDGSWNGVGVLPGLTPRRPGEQRECTPEEDYIVLGAITESLRGPGEYISLTRGWVERLEAHPCPSPSGPACYLEESLERRELADTVRFRVVRSGASRR